MAVPRVPIAPGYDISRLLKGGWQLAGGHGPVDEEQALADMRAFAEAGITTFDCADIYTGVESLIGAFRRRAGATIEVHTKCVPDLSVLPTLKRADVERLVERSLRRLGTDQLDLVQLHWWDYDAPRYVDAAMWLDDLRRAGKVRWIGATNFDVQRLSEIVEAGVPIASHQVQYSVLDRRPASGMVEFCRRHGINLLSYGALAGGFLSERWLGVPAPAEPLPNRSLAKYRLIIEELGGWTSFQELLQALARVAARRDVSIGTVALAWVLAQPRVAGAIVGATNAAHLPATLAAAGLQLGPDDLAEIAAVQASFGGPRGDVYDLEREKGGRHAAIMRYDLNREA